MLYIACRISIDFTIWTTVYVHVVRCMGPFSRLIIPVRQDKLRVTLYMYGVLFTYCTP